MAHKSLFGTDGVRGVANVDLTTDLAMGLARAAGDGRAGLAVVGRDTRRSGQMLASAVHAGFNAAGFDTVDLGIVPVGAVSFHTREMNAAFGVMVSASHNPAADNGIKFFGSDGGKLDDDHEAAIEGRLRHGPPWHEVSGGDVGIQVPSRDGMTAYLKAISAKSSYRLQGLEVVLDCAHGAAFLAGPRLFADLGADVEAINIEPTGMNINDGCGAVSTGMLAEHAAGRIGLAFDGDADRCIAVDEDGIVCNGDVILAILVRHLRGRGELPGDRVVTTVMSNLGFRLAMRKMGVELLETPVGDRYVREEMQRVDAGLGGEQSGHVLFRDRSTGDGLMTGMRLLEVVAATGAPLKELRRVMVEYPQVLRNVHVRVKERLADADSLWATVAAMEKRLGDQGRVLIRASGTEPLVRVMVEATESHEAAAIADDLVVVVRRELGGVLEGDG
ncbi:MAG: phosphoglucosamine mutase [Acidimicrobiia bacterium]